MKGQVFGSLTVLKYEDTGSNGARWECLCECGKHKVVDGYLLRRGTIKTCGCRININKNLVGKRFGKLLVIKEAGRHKDRSILWECRCDCGNISVTSSKNLIHGQSKSCGCKRKNNYGDAAINRIFKGYKDSAKKRNLEFGLSKKEFIEITSLDCYYCGIKPAQISKREFGNGNYVYNGIDRIDNLGGYTKENTVPCCFICNRAKGASDMEEFKEWLKRVANKWATQTKKS